MKAIARWTKLHGCFAYLQAQSLNCPAAPQRYNLQCGASAPLAYADRRVWLPRVTSGTSARSGAGQNALFTCCGCAACRVTLAAARWERRLPSSLKRQCSPWATRAGRVWAGGTSCNLLCWKAREGGAAAFSLSRALPAFCLALRRYLFLPMPPSARYAIPLPALAVPSLRRVAVAYGDGNTRTR